MTFVVHSVHPGSQTLFVNQTIFYECLHKVPGFLACWTLPFFQNDKLKAAVGDHIAGFGIAVMWFGCPCGFGITNQFGTRRAASNVLRYESVRPLMYLQGVNAFRDGGMVWTMFGETHDGEKCITCPYICVFVWGCHDTDTVVAILV